MLTATHNTIIVEPFSEAEKVFGIIIPDSAKNPMDQQGKVVSVGPEVEDVEVGDYILYHPFVGEKLYDGRKEYLALHQKDVAAFVAPDGEIFPPPNHVLVKPDFKPEGITKQGSLYVPAQVFSVDPPEAGVVLLVGVGVESVAPGDHVLYSFSAGNEIGLDTGKRRGVFYTIPEDGLLAILES